MQYDTVLDVKGLNCPLPLLKLKQLLSKVSNGEVVKVLATDPAAHLDIGVFIDKSAHQMLLFERDEDIQYFYIKAVI
ncbi:SirA-like domain-containing protein [Cycloclasticus sp. 46_83_sub15_T18]|nr:SirA-like domain-containing protein [Cycloclasticus sp. 46_83_sub15_T18]